MDIVEFEMSMDGESVESLHLAGGASYETFSDGFRYSDGQDVFRLVLG
jgi:hypothetical protein